MKQIYVPSTNPSRHLEMYFASTNDDFESLPSEVGKETSMAGIITEMGAMDVLLIAHIDDVAVSKLLGAVIGTQNSLGETNNTYATFVSAIRNSNMSESPQRTTCNTYDLVDSINELVTSTNWVHVMENLDHEGFSSVPDEAALPRPPRRCRLNLRLTVTWSLSCMLDSAAPQRLESRRFGYTKKYGTKEVHRWETRIIREELLVEDVLASSLDRWLTIFG